MQHTEMYTFRMSKYVAYILTAMTILILTYINLTISTMWIWLHLTNIDELWLCVQRPVRNGFKLVLYTHPPLDLILISHSTQF